MMVLGLNKRNYISLQNQTNFREDSTILHLHHQRKTTKIHHYCDITSLKILSSESFETQRKCEKTSSFANANQVSHFPCLSWLPTPTPWWCTVRRGLSRTRTSKSSPCVRGFWSQKRWDFEEKKLNTCLVFQPKCAFFSGCVFFCGESRAEILKICIDRFRFRWISHSFWISESDILVFYRSIPLHLNLWYPCLSSFLLGAASKGSLPLPRNHGLNLTLNKSAKCPKPKQKSNKKIQNPWKSTLLYIFLWIFAYKNTSCCTIFQEGQPKIISSSAHQIIRSLPKTLSAKQDFVGKVGSSVTRRPTETPLLSLPPKRTTAEPTNHRTVSLCVLSICQWVFQIFRRTWLLYTVQIVPKCV